MKGFTLIELLAVVLIIGILTGVAVPQYQKAITKSRQAKLLRFAKSLQQSAMVVLSQKGEDEVLAFQDLEVSFPAGWNVGEREAFWESDKNLACTPVFVLNRSSLVLSWIGKADQCRYPLISYYLSGEEAGEVECRQARGGEEGMCPAGVKVTGSLTPCEDDPDCFKCESVCQEDGAGGMVCDCIVS